MIVFIMSLSSIVLYANCDMIAMLAKEGNTISQFGNSSGTYEYPLDFFEYLMQRSINSGTKANPNGYGVIFYHSNSTIITYDPTNLYNEDNEAWYLVDTDYNDYYYHGSVYTTGYDDNNALNQAYDVILNQHGCENTEASIVLGHARKGTTGTGSHPFRFNLGDKTFTFIQNGGLENGITPNEPNIKLAIHTELNSLGWFSNHSFNWIDNPANATINQFIDSELLFHWIMKNIIDTNGSILEGCNRALTATVDGIDLSQELLTPYGYHDWINCVNFILSDGEKLYVFRNSESEETENDIWHNLSYSDLDEFYAIKTYGTELSTRIDQYDMVCFSKDEDPIEYPNFLDIDYKTFSSGYNWTSFPRLVRNENINEEVDIIPILETIEPTNFDYLDFDADGENDLVYDNFTWNHVDYNIQSTTLYKIKIDPDEERSLIVNGTRMEYDYTLTDPLATDEYHWLGYWLPESQNIEDAFGDLWEDVKTVKAEDWFYGHHQDPRGPGGPGEPQYPSYSPKGKTMEYGKGYVVEFYYSEENPEITDFQWTRSETIEEPERKEKSEDFNYAEKAEYEVIDVIGIDSGITEIGVYENDVCVGAVVVKDSSEQILVYSDNANRDPVPFTFEITIGRGSSVPIQSYSTLNLRSGEYEEIPVISGRQEYSVIKFGKQEEPENNIAMPILLGNYPNPFNPTTSISFSLPNEQDIELSIYNIKGQKVKTLYSGSADKGKHSMVWEGKDANDKSVSSGLYFYKLKTNNNVLTRKMIMLK